MIKSNFKIKVRYGQKDANGNITWKSEPQPNLINNGGLAMLADYWATECTENIYLETGGQENARASGAILLEQSGTSVTSDDPFFYEADALNDRVIIFANGSQAVVETFVNTTEVIVTDSKNVSAQIGTIYHVEETLMDGFAKASIAYETFVGANENVWSESAGVLTLTNKRTVGFPVEPVAITYKGVGWTPIAGDSNPVFGRKVMDIEIDALTAPIIEVTMTRRIECDAKSVPGSLIPGITETAESINLMGSAAYNGITYWSSIDSNGISVAPTQLSTFIECKVTEDADIAIGEYAGPAALGSIDITGSTYAANTVTPTYTIGNFYADYITTFNPSDFDSLAWNNISLLNALDATEAFWMLVFDTPQDFSGKILTDLTIRKSWNRYY